MVMMEYLLFSQNIMPAWSLWDTFLKENMLWLEIETHVKSITKIGPNFSDTDQVNTN